MLFSGPSAYYDDYIRKTGSRNFTLHDPPSLLTDRGAYVNFLEVQLERVSAACLAVTGYDDRFNDMQNLIVNLEERLQMNTKLLGLNQKSTEELRQNVHEELFKITSAHTESASSMQSEIDGLYGDLALIRGTVDELQEKISSLEFQTQESHEQIEVHAELSRNKFNGISADVSNIQDLITQLDKSIESTRTQASKNSFLIDELGNKTRNQIDKVISNNESSLIALKDELAHKFHEADIKQSSAVEKLHREVIDRELEMLASIRKYKEQVNDEFQAMIDTSTKRLSSAVYDDLRRLDSDITYKFQSIKDVITTNETRQESVECSINQHFDSFQGLIENIQSNQSVQKQVLGKLDNTVQSMNSFIAEKVNYMTSLKEDLDSVIATQKAQQESEKSLMKKDLAIKSPRKPQRVHLSKSSRPPSWQSSTLPSTETKKAIEIPEDYNRDYSRKQSIGEAPADVYSKRHVAEVTGSLDSTSLNVTSSADPADQKLTNFMEAYKKDSEDIRRSLELLSSTILSSSKVVTLSADSSPRNSPPGTPSRQMSREEARPEIPQKRASISSQAGSVSYGKQYDSHVTREEKAADLKLDISQSSFQHDAVEKKLHDDRKSRGKEESRSAQLKFQTETAPLKHTRPWIPPRNTSIQSGRQPSAPKDRYESNYLYQPYPAAVPSVNLDDSRDDISVSTSSSSLPKELEGDRQRVLYVKGFYMKGLPATRKK